MPESTLLRVRSDDVDLRNVARNYANAGDVPADALLLQLLLHLPRLADLDGIVIRIDAEREAERLADVLPRSARWTVAPAAPLDRYAFARVDDATARQVFATFHYLRSHRPDSRCWGLFAPDATDPTVLAAVSTTDVPHLARLGEQRLHAPRSLTLSRVFGFRDAPANAISRLLSLVSRQLRSEADGLLTYVNPNMGFRAASLRASNWRQIGEESPTRYRYVGVDYATDRRIAELPSYERRAVSTSTMPLAPLQVYGRRLGRSESPHCPF